jgi:hypothetical protein
VSYRVQVTEHRSAPLARVGDCGYRSPEMAVTDARGLLRVLLGRDPEPTCTRWSQPIAGGVRLVELEEVDR